MRSWLENFSLPWRKQSIRWLCWSALLLVPLAWWGYLATQYGTEPFSFYVSDFLDKTTCPRRTQQGNAMQEARGDGLARVKGNIHENQACPV